jgi:hypothetical protein
VLGVRPGREVRTLGRAVSNEFRICETSKTRQRVSHIVYVRNIPYYRLMARPKAYPIKKVVGFDPAMVERIRTFRFGQRINTENEAIRRLIELGLGNAPASAPPSGGTPGGIRKPASPGKTATPRAKKPTASDRQATAAQTKEAQIRALREQGA